ncbi:MAG TPA: heavy metal-associated domain-containing protein [Planctomycetota bacterium]|nr:heavy metal-associated domain-containing protein [Planctomycetota bacterium]
MTTTTKYSIPDMNCGHCEASIRQALAAVEGIEAVVVDLAAKTLSVHGGRMDLVREAIEGVGFDVEVLAEPA